MLRVGIIGMGKMGQLRAAVLNEIPGVKLCAVYDPFNELDRWNIMAGFPRGQAKSRLRSPQASN